MPCVGRSSAFLQESCSRHPLFSGDQEPFRYVFALGQLEKSVRGTNCTRHGIMRKSPPGNHSVHTDCPEDRARSPHRETSGRSRSCKTYQEPPSETPQSLRDLHHNTPDTLPPDYVENFSLLVNTTCNRLKYFSLIK